MFTKVKAAAAAVTREVTGGSEALDERALHLVGDTTGKSGWAAWHSRSRLMIVPIKFGTHLRPEHSGYLCTKDGIL